MTSIVTAVATTLVNLGVNIRLEEPIAINAAQAVTDNLITGAIKGKIEVEQIAVEALGLTVANEMATPMNQGLSEA